MSAAATTVTLVRIIHTSDWHLGRTLHGIDMHQHQAAFLDHLVQIVQSRDVDAVLVAGDVYDRAIPSVETITLLSDALRRLSEHATVVITPGNHDSATRLGFGAALMRDNIRILTSADRIHIPVILGPDENQICIYGLPYLDPDLTRDALKSVDGELPPRSHEGVLGAAIARINADIGQRRAAGHPSRTILMAHAFVVGGHPSDSERNITIGGVDSAPSGLFDGFDYVALGHLHGPQKITVPGSATLMRYSGSPLAYSISEADHRKSTVLLDLEEGKTPTVELIEAPVPRPMKQLRATIDQLLGAEFAPFADFWVVLKVTDDSYPTGMQPRLRARFAHALSIEHDPPQTVASTVPAVTEAMSPVEVGGQFVEFVTNAPATDADRALLRSAFEAANAAKQSS